uniref:Gonadotropin subunit beta-2 n=1 Tax=Sphaeramia orbicularis TaxID=375764 RepID=A0A673BGU6_9TELE
TENTVFTELFSINAPLQLQGTHNYTLWIEDHNCSQCMAINTTICSGYCYTQDTNFRGRIGRTFLIQRSCLPRSVVYRPAHMPSCPHNVDPHLYYPAAQSCSCRRCDTRTHRCIRTRRYSEDQCTVSPKSLYGHSNYF